MSSVDPLISSSTTTSVSQVHAYIESPIFQKLSPNTQDTLTQSLSTEELNALFAATPTLVIPNVPTFRAFLDMLAQSKLEFQQQLSASEFIDQVFRKQANQTAALQAALLGKLATTRKEKITEAQEESTDAREELKNIISDIDSKTNTMETTVDNVNKGNATQKSKSNQQVTDYQNFVSDIKTKLNANESPPGTFNIPSTGDPDKDEANIQLYNSLASEYNDKVSLFNIYTNQRKQELINYNTSVNQYNIDMSNNNKAIDNIIREYDLSDFLIEKNILYMHQSFLDRVDTSRITFVNNATYPVSPSQSVPFAVNADPPPSWVSSSAHQVPDIPKPSYTPISNEDLDVIKEKIYEILYQKKVAPIDYQINQAYLAWSYLNALNIYRPVEELSPDPLLNHKSILSKLIPPSFVNPSDPIATSSSTSINALSVQAAGIGSSRLEGMLGQALVKAFLTQLNIQLTEDQLAEFQTQFDLLALGLLTANGLQALFPGLGVLSNHLSSLPGDSSAFALLFSLSLMNRIQEMVQQGLTEASLETLLANLTSFANLNPEQLQLLTQHLTTALNVSLLLVATKLLEATLGLSGLALQLLPSFLPSDGPEINHIINQGFQEDQQDQYDLQLQSTHSFIQQGYGANEANFLADFRVRLTRQSVSPSASTVSRETVDTSFLTDSVKANLILSGEDEARATDIAERAVNQTLDEDVYSSSNQFHAALENQLLDLGVGKRSNEIAREAVLVPRQVPQLSPHTLNQLSETELIALLQQRSSELLTSQLGTELANFVTKEITKSLFGTEELIGTPNVDTRDQANVKSPYSLINVVRNEVYHLNIRENTEYNEALSESFKEFIKENINLNTFLEKLMDPANLFVYSVASGIMYSGREPSNWKKSIDILI